MTKMYQNIPTPNQAQSWHKAVSDSGYEEEGEEGFRLAPKIFWLNLNQFIL